MDEDETQKMEEFKVGIHSQHARLLKEDEETWISSEDLNTENSSDEEKNKNTIKRKLKTRKRSTPSIRLQKVPGYTTSILPSLVKPPADKSPMAGPSYSQDTDDDNYPDDISLPTISSTPRSSVTKLENLKDWRPTKGALASAVGIEDGGRNTRKLLNEASNFHKIMTYKLKELKSCSVLDPEVREEIINESDERDLRKTFKYLKNTPEVKAKLKVISDMEEEIDRTIEQYKVERADRLTTELKLCKDICKNKISMEHDTESFLRLCSFDRSEYDCRNFDDCGTENVYEEGIDHENQSETEESSSQQGNIESQDDSYVLPEHDDYFIRRNIHVAKEGAMAGLSLTDEQKSKIAEILKDIDNFDPECEENASVAELTELDDDGSEMSLNNAIEAPPTMLSRSHFVNNAFRMDDGDKARIDQINSELQLFSSDRPTRDQESPISLNNEQFWKQYVLSQQLKDIDDQLKYLYESYAADDEEKLRESSEGGTSRLAFKIDEMPLQCSDSEIE